MNQNYPGKILASFSIEIWLIKEEKHAHQEYSNNDNLQIFNAVILAITATTKGIENLLHQEATTTSSLVPLLNTNHRLLESIKTGAQMTDKIVSIANKYNVGCKITGAGFGGWLLAVYSKNSDAKGFKDEISGLDSEGVSIIDAEFSKVGLQCDSWEYN